MKSALWLDDYPVRDILKVKVAQNDESIPYGRITDSQALGALLRAHRQALAVTQETLAGLTGVGVRFVSEVERGKATAELGKVLHVLQQSGLELWVLPRGQAPDRTPP
ncbi:MAG: helix-turn-helix domain-containing protein [Polyangiales bacterium]